MPAAGADRQAIWPETAWFQGQDGEWRFEIDDSGATLNRPRKPVAHLGESGKHLGPLPRMFDHEAAYAAYPELRKIEVMEADMEPGAMAELSGVPVDPRDPAWITLSPRYPDPRSATLHEVQHGIQELEGFSLGSMPDAGLAAASRRSPAVEAEARRRASWRHTYALPAR